ncbi:NAD-dependent epimerase/dehydratase family protein [Alphaproteobacteria bacterium]|nr:NAD-dependent epimerase/dehydratase family protein [Alphaproteobacteria bacterium]
MKIFITGVAGFLGSHIADKMIELDHEVIGCDNLIGGYLDNIPSKVKFHNFDLNHLEGLSSLMTDCDIVYHTACTAYEGLSVFSPSLVTANTFGISVNAMTGAIQAGVKKFIHCSSMARYGENGAIPFTEDMPCKPKDPYGIAKFSAEILLRNLSETHGIDLVIAVPHNIIGPRQKYDDPYRNVASIMVNLMLQGKSPVIYGDGNQIRCFSDVRDVIDCLVKLAFDQRAVGQIFNIGPDEEAVTINNLFELLANKLKFNKAPIYMPGRPQEVKHATCSANKIREYFNYKTSYNLSQSLDSVINYISLKGAKNFEYHLDIEILNENVPKTWSSRLF